jgi:hypothetical protein
VNDWSTPVFEEIKMDAEIGSYQEDDRRGDEFPLVVTDERA